MGGPAVTRTTSKSSNVSVLVPRATSVPSFQKDWATQMEPSRSGSDYRALSVHVSRVDVIIHQNVCCARIGISVIERSWRPDGDSASRLMAVWPIHQAPGDWPS